MREEGICLLNDVHVLYLCVPTGDENMGRYLKTWPVRWWWLQRVSGLGATP